MRAWTAFLCVVLVCKLLELFAVSSDVGAESPPFPDARVLDGPLSDAAAVDAPLPVDAMRDGPLAVDAPRPPDARPPDAGPPDAPIAVDARPAPDAPMAMSADDGGCGCAAGGGAADLIQIGLLLVGLTVIRLTRK